MDFTKIKSNLLELTTNKLAYFMFLLGMIAMYLVVDFTDIELVKLANKLVNVGIVTLLFVLYKVAFYGKDFYTDAKISENPIAVALDGTGFIIAVAYSLSIGS